ncbi:MAG: TIGR01777 family oxidoreductase [Ilumatobacteraceae bacterium]|nr:TIGR01777 family oxidoreductase [Ilumatobacteraceae bacterium]
MRIVVSGASGLIGSALVPQLTAHGHEVVRLVRRTAKQGESTWNPARGDIDASVIDGADAVIHLSGAGIGDKRWSNSYKREILDSRVKSTKLLASVIAGAAKRPSVFLSGSAIGIYGACGDEPLHEDAAAGTGFLADVCKEWEAAAVGAGTRTVFLRTGIVLSTKGGALKKQLPLFRAGLGGRFGRGNQWQSWISIDDEVSAIEHLLTSSLQGAVNLTAPAPITNADFAAVMGKVLRRPAVLAVPSIGPKLLLGGELANALLFTGQRVIPAALSGAGFEFSHPTLEIALRALLQK